MSYQGKVLVLLVFLKFVADRSTSISFVEFMRGRESRWNIHLGRILLFGTNDQLGLMETLFKNNLYFFTQNCSFLDFLQKSYFHEDESVLTACYDENLTSDQCLKFQK